MRKHPDRKSDRDPGPAALDEELVEEVIFAREVRRCRARVRVGGFGEGGGPGFRGEGGEEGAEEEEGGIQGEEEGFGWGREVGGVSSWCGLGGWFLGGGRS